LESGLIENMAQTVALHTGYDFFLKDEVAPTGYIGSIKKVDILKLPALNDIITTKVDILHEFNGVTMVAVKVYNANEEEIASGEMKTVIANQ
jgi:predicted hotdog family 3-hydroxylacyl-ACP dehydratase